MTSGDELTQRQREVLASLVSEYIATGEPSGSKTLSQKYRLNCSSATIRAIMAELEAAGLVFQPHTSAGRLPTDPGIRLFVDHLIEWRLLTGPERRAIQARSGGVTLGGERWDQVVCALSELAQQPAVLSSPRTDVLVLRQLRFVPIGSGEVLAVIVSTSGVSQSRMLRVSLELSASALERIHNHLNELVPGRTLFEAREVIERELEEARRSMDRILLWGLELGRDALHDDEGLRSATVHVHGQAKLVQSKTSLAVESLRSLMELLDDREKLVRLLDATLEGVGPVIVIGAEHPFTGSAECSVIAASFSRGPESFGTLAVVGPKSMNYAKLVPLVAFMSEAISTAPEA